MNVRYFTTTRVESAAGTIVASTMPDVSSADPANFQNRFYNNFAILLPNRMLYRYSLFDKTITALRRSLKCNINVI